MNEQICLTYFICNEIIEAKIQTVIVSLIFTFAYLRYKVTSYATVNFFPFFFFLPYKLYMEIMYEVVIQTHRLLLL